MKILAIETSCDETALAILECTRALPTPDFKVLGEVLLSQVAIHEKYGGVYPMLAKREHQKNLPVLLKKVFEESRVDEQDIDYIAVTKGPGLEPALWTGIEFAKDLGRRLGKPVIPVNHMAGHLFSFLFERDRPAEFPLIALLVSGGHTELVLMEDFHEYHIIGETRDDAVGEAFDKVGRLLGLTYPAGPAVSRLAEIDRKVRETAEFPFPRPMLHTNDYNFSYSGLKTAVLYKLRDVQLTDELRASTARSFEEAAIEPLIKKTIKAAADFGAITIILGGGVSANTYLREKLKEEAVSKGLDLRLPPQKLTTDNAVMIGMAAYISLLTNEKFTDLQAEGSFPLQSS